MSLSTLPAAQPMLRCSVADTTAACDSHSQRFAGTAANDPAIRRCLAAGSITSAQPLQLAAERPTDALPRR